MTFAVKLLFVLTSTLTVNVKVALPEVLRVLRSAPVFEPREFEPSNISTFVIFADYFVTVTLIEVTLCVLPFSNVPPFAGVTTLAVTAGATHG